MGRWLVVLGLLPACQLVFPFTGDPPDATAGADSPADLPPADASGDANMLMPPSPPMGLVAWYRMESLPGSQVDDESSFAHVARCSACPAVIPGVYGNATRFDAVQRQVMNVAQIDTIAPQAGITVAMFIQIAGFDTPAYQCAASQPYQVDVENTWMLCVSNTGVIRFETLHDNQGPLTDILDTDEAVIVAGTRYHVAVSFDGSQKRIWVNGTVAKTRARGGGLFYDAFNPILVGAESDRGSTTFFFDGLIDELQIYNRGLSTSEMFSISTFP